MLRRRASDHRKLSTVTTRARRSWELPEKATFSMKRRLLYFPGVARAKKLGEVAATALGDDVFDLLVHHVFVARHIAPRAENSDGRGEIRAVLHVRELEGVCRTRMVRVVNDQIRLGDAVAELDDFDVAVRFPADTLVAVLAENHRLAMFELEDVLAAGVAVRQGEPRAVVEDVAVLQNFHVSRTFVRGRVLQRLFQVSLENVNGAGHEGGFGTDGQRYGIERPVPRSKGCRFRFLVEFRSRGVLPLRQAVDLVVEQQHLDANIAPQHVDGVIAANRKRISVARGHPYFQVGTNGFKSARHRVRAAVSRLEAIRVHVIREAAGAADSGDDDKILFLDPQFRKY